MSENEDINQKIKEAEKNLRDLSIHTESDSKRESTIPTMGHMVVAMASTLGMLLGLVFPSNFIIILTTEYPNINLSAIALNHAASLHHIHVSWNMKC